MAIIGRARVPEPPAEAQLAALTARHDQTVAAIDDLLRQIRPARLVPARYVADALLDVRAALRPPSPGADDA